MTGKDDMVSGGSEEGEAVEQAEPGDLDQDFEFIDEVLANYMHDIQEKEAVLVHVKRTMEKGKKKIPEELREETCSEV